MNLEISGILGLIGFTMYISVLVVVNCAFLQKLTTYIEGKTTGKIYDNAVVIASFLWMTVGMALMVVGR